MSLSNDSLKFGIFLNETGSGFINKGSLMFIKATGIKLMMGRTLRHENFLMIY